MTSPSHATDTAAPATPAAPGPGRAALAAILDGAVDLLGAARVAVLIHGIDGGLRPVARRGYPAEAAQSLAAALAAAVPTDRLAAGERLAPAGGGRWPGYLAAWQREAGEQTPVIVALAPSAEQQTDSPPAGVLVLGWDPPARMTHTRLDGVRRFATLAALALRGARRSRDAEREQLRLGTGPDQGGGDDATEPSNERERFARALSDVLTAFGASDDTEEVSRIAAAALLRELPGVDLVHVWAVDGEADSLRSTAAASRGGDTPAARGRLPLGDGSGAAFALREERLVIWEGKQAAWPEAVREFARRRGLVGVAHVPMQSAGRGTGVITLGSRAPRSYTPAEQAFLMRLAAQLGGLIEIRRGHARMEAEQRRLQSLIETLPEGLIIVRPDGRTELSNQAAADILGRRPLDTGWQERVRIYAARMPDGRTFPADELPLTRALRGETVRAVEMVMRRPDGADVPLLVSAGPVRSPDGAITGALTVFQDITRLKELDRLKDDFINTVSHELRTPTTTIRGGALTLLRRGDRLDEATRRQLLQDIAEESERLHHLVEDLLSLSRSQAGMRINPEPLRLHRLVNKVILDLGTRVGSRALTVDVPADLPVVEADPVALEQVLRNVVENAVKYSPRGGRVEVVGETQADEILISVLDHGAGLQPGDVEQVFEPFFRADAAVRSGAGGAGLGLAVCRRLVEMQGGRIWAENRPGGGAVFRFTLPVAPAVDD